MVPSVIPSLLLLAATFSSQVAAHPHETHDHTHAVRANLPGTWYHSEAHPVHALFKRNRDPLAKRGDDGIQYAAVGTPGSFFCILHFLNSSQIRLLSMSAQNGLPATLLARWTRTELAYQKPGLTPSTPPSRPARFPTSLPLRQMAVTQSTPRASTLSAQPFARPRTSAVTRRISGMLQMAFSRQVSMMVPFLCVSICLGHCIGCKLLTPPIPLAGGYSAVQLPQGAQLDHDSLHDRCQHPIQLRRVQGGVRGPPE